MNLTVPLILPDENIHRLLVELTVVGLLMLEVSLISIVITVVQVSHRLINWEIERGPFCDKDLGTI